MLFGCIPHKVFYILGALFSLLSAITLAIGLVRRALLSSPINTS